jgi:integrase
MMSLKFSRLHRSATQALKSGERLIEHGITAERLRTGDIRFSINIMVDGQRIHRVIGRESEGVTRFQAEQAIESIRTKAREGRLDLPKSRKLYRTFAEAAKEYLERMEESGGKNIGPKRMHLGRHLSPYFGSQRVDQLKEFALRTYRKKRLDSGSSEATVNREMATLSHLLKSAVRWEWFGADRIPPIPKGKETRQPIVVLSQLQASALMTAAIHDQDQRLWLFVMFGLGAAMRHREILRVRYEQIDFHTRRLFIPEAKAGEREQPITPALADALKRQQQMEEDQEGWVFPTAIPGQSKAGHRTNMARQFARAVVRAGLDPDKVTPHTMRHTAITRLVKAGVDLPTIQKISGHKTLAMVLRYVHVHGEHIDAAIRVLDSSALDTITPELHTPAIPNGSMQGAVVAISAGKTKR